jgi:hypothetical protein
MGHLGGVADLVGGATRGVQESTVMAGVGVERQPQFGIARELETSRWPHTGPRGKCWDDTPAQEAFKIPCSHS